MVIGLMISYYKHGRSSDADSKIYSTEKKG
jgi:hypothetical protein